MIKKVRDWKDYYKKTYLKNYLIFSDDFRLLISKYSDFSQQQKADFFKKYYDFTRKTLKTFAYLFFNNGLFTKSEKTVILYILNLEISSRGKDFFKLVKALKKLKNNDFLNTTEHEKFLDLKYLSIFDRFNDFFKSRMKKEEEYGF